MGNAQHKRVVINQEMSETFKESFVLIWQESYLLVSEAMSKYSAPGFTFLTAFVKPSSVTSSYCSQNRR